MKRRSRTKPSPPEPVFFVDRSLGSRKLPAALEAAGFRVERHDDHFSEDAADVEWLSFVGARGWVALTKDVRIGRDQFERDVLMISGVGAVFVVGKNMTAEQMADMIIRNKRRIERFARNKRPPYIAKLYDRRKQSLVTVLTEKNWRPAYFVRR